MVFYITPLFENLKTFGTGIVKKNIPLFNFLKIFGTGNVFFSFVI